MIFKSRQVNLDPEPYLSVHTGRRYRASIRAQAEATGDQIFAPRPEFEPTRDPEPWVEFDGWLAIRSAIEPRDDNAFAKYEWAPRRERFDTPVNRIIVLFRQHAGKATLPDHAQLWLDVSADAADWEPFSPDEIDHARRVLTRLANWKEQQ